MGRRATRLARAALQHQVRHRQPRLLMSAPSWEAPSEESFSRFWWASWPSFYGEQSGRHTWYRLTLPNTTGPTPNPRQSRLRQPLHTLGRSDNHGFQQTLSQRVALQARQQYLKPYPQILCRLLLHPLQLERSVRMALRTSRRYRAMSTGSWLS